MKMIIDPIKANIPFRDIIFLLVIGYTGNG